MIEYLHPVKSSVACSHTEPLNMSGFQCISIGQPSTISLPPSKSPSVKMILGDLFAWS